MTWNKQRGYDADFLTKIPEDLTCMICSLVFRDPVQLDCGDRFCALCFGDLVEHSTSSGCELLCPIDRQAIERDKIFIDKGITRTIKNLQVRCKNVELGCDWTGGLVDLESHGASCRFQAVAASNQDAEMKYMCEQLFERLQRCEEHILLKEKELAHLKFTIKEMKENTSKNEEIRELKEELIYLKLTVNDMKDDFCRNNEMKILKDSVSQLQNKVDVLIKENKEIAQKYENELKQSRRTCLRLENELQNNRKIITSLEDNLCCKKGFKPCIETSQIYTNQQIAFFEEKCEKKIINQNVIKANSLKIEKHVEELKIASEKQGKKQDVIQNTLDQLQRDLNSQLKQQQITVPNVVRTGPSPTVNRRCTSTFMDVDIDGQPIGRIVIQLLIDKFPKTCDKFIKLCTHAMGIGYRGSFFHNIGHYYCSAGKNLTPQYAIFPPALYTPDEKSDAGFKKGQVSMVKEDNLTKSVFSIHLFRPGVNEVVFGQVSLASLHVVETIRDRCVMSRRRGKKLNVMITDCGVL